MIDTDEAWTSSVTVQEWRLTGQPGGGYPFYDFTFRSDREYSMNGERVQCSQAFIDYWVEMVTAEWADVKVQTRTIRTLSTEWVIQ